MTTEKSPEPITFTKLGVRRGFFMAQPLAPGVALYGVVFGVLAAERSISWIYAMLMSVFVYSGSAQLAALQNLSQSTLVLPLVATILVMNARYVLYGAAIQPWLAGTTRGRALASLFFMGDGNWALSMKEYHDGYRDAGYVLGSGVAMFVPWVGGTLVGHLLANNVPNPAQFGLDFMLVAFAAAIGISVWRGKSDLWPAAAAALTAFVLHKLVPGGWYIVGAGLAGAIVGALRHGR
ncbi:MAG: AzlC family ABC transporter permease [Burkholderiaceae bacterium]